jgi:hypothetical protein
MKRALLAVCCASLVAGCSGASDYDVFAGNGTDASINVNDGDIDGGAGDATTDGSPTADARKDSDTPPPSGRIQCGFVTCAVGTEVCCRKSTGPAVQNYCSAPAACVSSPLQQTVAIPCDDAADCTALGKPGTVCCASLDQNAQVTEITCREPRDCRSQQGRYNLCDKNAADPCPNGGTCKPTNQTLPGYNLCY